MDSMYTYQIIGAIHVIVFIIYMALLKFVFKKSVKEKMIFYYVLAWIIGWLIFSITVIIIYDIPFDENVVIAIFGEFAGSAVAFLFIDYILFYLGKWFYKKINKKNTDFSGDKTKYTQCPFCKKKIEVEKSTQPGDEVECCYCSKPFIFK